ncbi:hypothetical protein GCM10009712_06910 [Pseudarthrobacter sulfonivorans]|uniref:DUF937 domain-containing protein n=1 Tax=Pseudarthrobacter sulfonivorans TaxID=121292 RepID=UPI00168BD1E4|nr:DUF937 domain-containing protein [Pseudarthrobacter sulfonivorans]
MTEIHDLLNQIDVNQVASLLGTDPATAQSAVEAALPTLLAGMHTNAQAPDGAASLQSALGQHQDGLLDGGVDVSQVNTADGEKIVGHVFGGQQDQVAAQLAGTAGLGGVGGDLIRKALPILAPIVMSYLAKKFFGQGGQGGGQASQPGGAGAGGVGAGGVGAGQAGGLDLGGILGGILGAGAGAGAGGNAGPGQQGSVLDSILGGLGGLLGGGTGAGTGTSADDGTGAGAGTGTSAADGTRAGSGAGTGTSEEPPAGQRPDAAQEPGLQRLPGERSVQPSEAIQVDLPSGEKTPKEEDQSGGLGGLLGGLFGKK